MSAEREKSKILIVIPARGGSVGVPRKNIRILNGIPLIAYSIQAALDCKYCLDVIVSTDDEEIADIAQGYGAKIPFLRPKDISGSKTTLILVSKHALEYYEEKDVHYDAILSLQPTAPLISAKTIDKVVEKYLTTDATSVITVSEFTAGHPYAAKRIADDGGITDFVKIPEGAVTFPRQKREKAYYVNGAVYLREADLIKEYVSGGWQLGDTPLAVIMDEYESVDINNEFDFKAAEFLLSSR